MLCSKDAAHTATMGLHHPSLQHPLNRKGGGKEYSMCSMERECVFGNVLPGRFPAVTLRETGRWLESRWKPVNVKKEAEDLGGQLFGCAAGTNVGSCIHPKGGRLLSVTIKCLWKAFHF